MSHVVRVSGPPLAAGCSAEGTAPGKLPQPWKSKTLRRFPTAVWKAQNAFHSYAQRRQRFPHSVLQIVVSKRFKWLHTNRRRTWKMMRPTDESHSWWATVYCSVDTQMAAFTFIDCGVGIFQSVKAGIAITPVAATAGY